MVVFLIMNNNNLERILILLFLCFTYDAAKSPKKITNSNQHQTLSGLSFFMKPWQVKEAKQIDMEDYQKHTMEWAHKRLILFTQNIDLKVFKKKRVVKTKTMEKVSDKKTVFSLQWQDMKSHFLLPMSKRHIHVYTDETFKQLKKIKTEFFKVLEQYSIKLQNLWNDNEVIIEQKYKVELNPHFDPNKDLIAEKTALHDEMLSLLKDLPQRLMYWKSWETELLTRFAEAFGPLPTTDTIEQKRKNFGKDVKGAKVFTAADLDGDDEEEDSEKEESSDSDSSSSDSSSSGSGSDYDTEFFNTLTQDYFMSDGESSVHHDQPPSSTTVLPQSIGQTHKPSGNPTDSDGEIHSALSTLQAGTDWREQKALAQDRQETEKEREKNIAEGKFNCNQDIEKLKERLVQSLLDMEENDESRIIVREQHPEIIENIEKLKELMSKTHHHHHHHHHHHPQSSPSSHSSQSSFPHHTKDNGNMGNTDHSIQTPPKSEEAARPSIPTRTVEPSLSSGGLRRPQPDPAHDPKGTISGSSRSVPHPPTKEIEKDPLPKDQSGSSAVRGQMSVKQEKSSEDEEE